MAKSVSGRAFFALLAGLCVLGGTVGFAEEPRPLLRDAKVTEERAALRREPQPGLVIRRSRLVEVDRESILTASAEKRRLRLDLFPDTALTVEETRAYWSTDGGTYLWTGRIEGMLRGHMVLAVGNDSQFRKLCEVIGLSELADHPEFATNVARVKHRHALIAKIGAALLRQTRDHWIHALERVSVPCGPVNTLSQVFDDPHVRHREMVVSMPHRAAGSGSVRVLANPIRLSETPVQYRITPPMRDEHRAEILRDWLGREA